MRWLGKIFQRKEKQQPQPLMIEGVGQAPMTPEPDDAELAAQALMELMVQKGRKAKQPESEEKITAPELTKEHYSQLARKIRMAHADAALRAMRFITFCEQELQNDSLPLTGPGSLQLLEAELYKRFDTAEREGGDLKRRWQHCLAEVTVRMMRASESVSASDSSENEITQ